MVSVVVTDACLLQVEFTDENGIRRSVVNPDETDWVIPMGGVLVFTFGSTRTRDVEADALDERSFSRYAPPAIFLLCYIPRYFVHLKHASNVDSLQQYFSFVPTVLSFLSKAYTVEIVSVSYFALQGSEGACMRTKEIVRTKI